MTYSPFLPICKTTGKVLQVKIDQLDKKRKSLIYSNPISGFKEKKHRFSMENVNFNGKLIGQ